MAASSDFPKSPLENVWRQFVPQGHDQNLRNAFYNVAAAVFVGGAAAAAWSVYLILQPFIQALLWAVLCGSVLHPLKFRIATSARKWLNGVQDTKSLLSLSVALLPVTFLDNLSESIGCYIIGHMREVVAVTVILPIVYIIIHHTPLFLSQSVYFLISSWFTGVTFFLDVVNYLNYIVIVAIITYFGMVVFSLSSSNQVLFRRLSLPVWLLSSASFSCLFPAAVKVPLFFILVLLIFLGIATQVTDILRASGNQSQSEVKTVFEVFKNVCFSQDNSFLSDIIKNESTKRAEEEPPKDPTSVGTPGSSIEETPRKERLPEQDSSQRDSEDEELTSNFYLKTVFFACVLVELWRHSVLLSFFPLAIGYYFIKKTTSYHVFGEGGILRGSMQRVQEEAHSTFRNWFESRRDVILAPPILGALKLMKRIDRRVVQKLSLSVDGVVTSVIMLVFLLFLVVAAVFLAVQVQGEGMILLSMGSQLVNSSIVNNPQLLELLPNGLNDVLSSAVDNGYIYGREWLSSIVQNVLGHSQDEKSALLEKQVIELWDQIYQAWVVASPKPPFTGPVVTSAAVAVTFDSLVDGFMKTPGLISLSTLSDVIRDNLGTVMSVLEGIWTILLSNLSLVFTAMTTMFSLVLGGSLSILNGLLNVVVFLSSLFYIVSISDEVYKPVAILSTLGPGQINSLGSAVEDSVNGVFMASMKMGAFYGMWTWLLHSVFNTNIVYIPSVLGSIFGAVPLLGTYWAAFPGALELIWVHGSPFMGLFLVLAQMLPMSCVDTAVYSEIKGGGHPYLTGLAVAGGIFCWGVQGAIFGPILLCILLVVTKIYTSLIQSPTDFSSRIKILRRNNTLM